MTNREKLLQKIDYLEYIIKQAKKILDEKYNELTELDDKHFIG